MRDWTKILVDAALRGLSATETAREQGVNSGCVASAAKRRALALPKMAKGVKKGAKRPEAGATFRANKSKIWSRRFAESDGLTITEFCLRWHISQDTAVGQAKRHGFKFAPSGASRKKTRQREQTPSFSEAR